MNDNDEGVTIQVKSATCARCGRESYVWGEIMFPEGLNELLEEEDKKHGHIAPPPNVWIPHCPQCINDFRGTPHEEFDIDLGVEPKN
jgi:hypothetical protein